MSFLHPEFLYYMLPPVVVLFALLMTQKESQAHFFSEEVMQKLRVSANTLTMKARNALFFLMAVLLVIALADPVIPEGEVEIKAKSSDIMLALDISDSMLAEDVYPNRLKLAKQKALELLRLAPNERIGVVAFAKNSYLVSPLSFDHDAVAFLLRELDTDSITEKGTNFMAMLEAVSNNLKKENKKYLLVLSDGGDKKEFSDEIAYAKEHKITVFVLGIGTTKGAPIKEPNGDFIKQNGKIIISKLNENIADLATQTGGTYIQSTTSNKDIEAMLHEIETHAEKKELQAKKVQKYIPLFYYPLGLAMILLLIATSSMSKRVKVEVPAAFILFFAFSFLHVEDASAGLLDFKELSEAQKAYEAGEYEKAQHIYESYAKKSDNEASYYNSANALYKAKKYKDALKMYEKSVFADTTSNAHKYANMGNSYAKMGGEKNLKSAIESYEKSLKLKEDKETRENLEAVKKALKKMQQKKQQQQKKNNKENKNDKNKKQNDKQNKQEQKQNKQGKQNKQEKQNQNKQQSGSGDKKKEQSHKSQNNDKKQKGDENKQNKQEGKKQKDEEKKQQNKNAQKSQKSSKEQQKQQNGSSKEKGLHMKKTKMSDDEERKWMQKLRQKQKTFLYQLNTQKNIQRDYNEKPW